MRLTLVKLSNLRALLVIRAVSIGLVLAVLCAASAPRVHAAQRRVHHRATSPSANHRHAASKGAHSGGSASTHIKTSSIAHRRTVHHRATIVRARMPVRRYSWMKNGATRSRRGSAVVEARETSAGSAETQQRSNLSAQRTSVVAGEIADPADSNTASPQDAADQIAAAELPAAPHAELHAAAVPDPFLSKNIVKMAPLRGSLESLIRQNEKTNADNLERIEDDADLEARITNGQLVRVPESSGLAVNPSLPEDRRYCRPWTASFLKDLSKAHETQFHRSFEVSSAVRTVAYQKHLMRTNGNAAPAEGDVASPHLTGATIDIAKRGLTRSELYWMRNRLQALQDQGKIDVEEEFRQSCFHITVYKSYVGAGPARKPNPHTLQTPEDDESPAAPADQPVHPA